MIRQAPAGPFGIADTTARSLLSAAARNPRSLNPTHAFVTTVRHAYERLPAAARTPAVTAAFKWAKAYVTSATFAATYAAARQQTKPAGEPDLPSVDEELQKKLDEQRASLEESKKGVAMLPAADRAAALAAFKEAEDRLRDPALIKAYRDDIQSRRDADSRGTADARSEWSARYPAEPAAFVRQELQRFLDSSAHVDFSMPITLIENPGGAIVGFVAPMTDPPESWIDAECMMAGKDMVLAARAAAGAWIAEMSK